jgi:hypothetical protein
MAIELPVNYMVGIVIGVLLLLLGIIILATAQGLNVPLLDQLDKLLKGLGV